MKHQNSITDIPGIKVGHAQDHDAITGCTVILCENGAVGGVDQRGGAPGTRETDLLQPIHLIEKVHAILLSGGSAFGLDAATGVMRYLEEKGIGFDTKVAKVPIVPAAILYDLAIGKAHIRPDAEMGYSACLNASSEPPEEGNAGAGTGATVGKILGRDQSMKGGIGCSSQEIGGKIIVGAIAAVNVFGDVIDLNEGKIIAGARTLQKGPLKLGQGEYFANTMHIMNSLAGRTILKFAMLESTAIGVIATNAKLNKEQANKVAQMAHDGLARTISPAHTMLDGDTIFAVSCGDRKADVNIVGAFAAQVMANAVIQAVLKAQPADGFPSATSTQI